MDDIEIFPPYLVINAGVILFGTALFIVFILWRTWTMLRQLPADPDVEMLYPREE